MNKIKIGAIIVNYNSKDYLGKCLSALFAQTTPFEIIIVIDNDLNGGTPIIEYKENLHYIAFGYNSGFAKANNIALQIIKNCEWVALINPDVFLDSNWLSEMCNACIRYPKIKSFASCLIMANNTSIIDGLGDKYHISGLAWRNFHGKSIPALSETETFSACAAAALYHYNTLMDLDGFDDDFFCYFEDVDVGFRLRNAGHRCLLIPNAIAYHVGYSATGGRHSDFAIYHGHRNLVWTYAKNMPGVLLWIFLPLHIALNILSIFYFVILGKGKTILKAKFDALKELPAIWKKRKKIQNQRRISLSRLLKALSKNIIPKFYS